MTSSVKRFLNTSNQQNKSIMEKNFEEKPSVNDDLNTSDKWEQLGYVLLLWGVIGFGIALLCFLFL